MFFRLSYPNTVAVGFHEFSSIDANIMLVNFSKAVSTIVNCGLKFETKAVHISPQIPYTTNTKLNQGSKVDISLLPWPQTITRAAVLPTSHASDVKGNFPCVIVEQQKQGVVFTRTVRSSIEKLSVPITCLDSLMIKPSMRKCERAMIDFGPASTSPFPLCLSPCEKTDLLALRHNDFLYRISKGLRFIGEVDEGVEKFEELREEIRSWVDLYGPKAATRKIWAEYPGAAACFLVLSGVYEYTHGEYWDFALSAISIPCTPPYQRYWGQPFLWFLLAIGLNPFNESGLRYVGPILGHAMVPNDCLPEFFGQLLEPAVRSPAWIGLSVQELIAAWLSYPAIFVGVDKPVWQFLRYGGRVAEEFVSEAVRLAQKRYETGLIPQACEFMLPQRIVQHYKIWLEQQREPPSPRSPFLRLDPYSGILLAFPEQRLPAHRAEEICSWEVSVAGRKLRGTIDYAQRRGEEAVFSASEISVSPDGPYEIKLVVGEETVGTWYLEGMTVGRSWKAFSGRNYKELDVSRSLRAEPTWIVITRSGTIIVRDFCSIALPDVETQRCHLSEDWIDYKAIEVNLSAAATLEVLCGNYTELVNVEHPEGEVVFTGGDLRQSADNSPDNIVLFGDAPPKVFLRTKLGEESDSIDNVRMRIAGHGIKGSHTRELSSADISSASQVGAGHIIIDLRQIIPFMLCPGELTIILWYRGRRAADIRFRWVPDLRWEWSQDVRTVRVYLPEGVTISEKREGKQSQPFTPANSCHIAALPAGHHDIDLVLSWQRSDLLPFSIPLRLHGPRWAFLRQPSDTPVWKVEPVEMMPDDLLKEDSPCILLEARDCAWQDVDLHAKWIGCAKEEPTVDLKAERLVRNDRWLIRLAEIADTLRKFRDTDSHTIVEGTISGFHCVVDVQICVMRLLSPQMFQWAVQLNEVSPLEWNEVCVDVDLSNLIEGDSPQLLFETKGGRWEEVAASAFWQSLNQDKPFRMLSPEACTEIGRWRIDLVPVLEYIEASPEKESEVVIELNATGTQEDEEVKIVLIRIHFQPEPLQTYEECLRWAEGNRLRLLALDLLCDLSCRWAPVDLLAIDWNIPSELVQRALRVVKSECPDITVTERNNMFAMSRETYRRTKPVLTEWNQQRMWNG